MRENRKILIAFTIFAIFVLAFGFFRLKESIAGPFRLPKNETPQLTEEDLYQILSQRDTDGDGLSDWQEIFVYGTSPYLVDSDGDGFSDYEEVMAESDPLDPKSTPLDPEPKESSFFDEKENDNEDHYHKFSPNKIRETLLRVGLDSDILNEIDDETLKILYNETVKETGIDLIELTEEEMFGFGRLDFSQHLLQKENFEKEILEEGSEDKNLFFEELSDFNNLEPSFVRKLMISSGLDPLILDQIDDQTLMTLFFQIVQETQ